MDLSFYSRILTLQERHQKLHSSLREANSPCVLTGCSVCPLSCCLFFPSSLLCLQSTRTVNLRGKTGSLIALVSGGFHGLPSGFFSLKRFSPRSGWALLAFCLGHVFRPPSLSPGPRSTHPTQGSFSSWNWYRQVEPKANKELAVCLQCEMTPAER